MNALLDRLLAVPRAVTANVSDTIASTIAPRWQTLSPAGQRVISVASVLLAAGLIWALVYQPIQTSRDKDRGRITGMTGLQSQLRQMQTQASEVQRLRTLAPVAATASLATADVAQLQALFGSQASVSLATNTKGTEQPASTLFRIAVKQMPYASLVERLEQTGSRFRLRVVSASLTRAVGAAPSTPTPTPTPATVSGDVIFADAR